MQLTVIDFMSLDGVIQSPGHPDEDRDGGFVGLATSAQVCDG